MSKLYSSWLLERETEKHTVFPRIILGLGDNSREAIISNIGSDALNILFYYIDTSVLLENIPHVKFIKTTSRTRVVYFP